MGERLPASALVFDWNTAGNGYPHRDRPVEFDDETLRDGLQSPSVRDPDIETKIRLLHLMEELGIHTVDVGLPGAGPRACADITALCREIVGARLRITPNCAVRTVRSDITALIEISQKVGIPIEACTFIGSSPIRQYAEEWTLDHVLKLTEEAVSYAARNALPVMYVTEDTCRATPDTITRLYKTAINAGATRICVCDTVGHITPRGVRNLIPYVRQLFGQDAFRTATGVHAAAIIKARKKGEDWLADRVYSGVPAGMVGSRQRIEVGFMSGVSNVVYWLHEHGLEPTDHLVEEIFRAAKERNRVLTDDEILEICKFEALEKERPLPLDTLRAWKKQIEGS